MSNLIKVYYAKKIITNRISYISSKIRNKAKILSLYFNNIKINE